MVYKPYIPSYASLTPNTSYAEVSTGYTLSPARIGAPTKPDTANQIAEVTARLNEGMKTVEMGTLGPEVFETIPKQQFKEINQLAKLTGSEITVHAPMIDPAGFTQQGWSEVEREKAERQLSDVMEKSFELNKEGNVPVTLHSSGVPAWEWQASLPAKEKGKAMMVAVNQETGQLIPIKREEKFYPQVIGAKIEKGEKIKGRIFTPEEEIDTVNRSEWFNTVTNLAHFKKEGDELLNYALPAALPVEKAIVEGRLNPLHLTNEDKSAIGRIKSADLYYEDVESKFLGAFNKAYKFGDKEIKEKLNDLAKEWYKDYKEMGAMKGIGVGMIQKKSEALGKAIVDFNRIIENPEMTPPKLYAPVEEFAMDHAAKTIGNVAFNAFKKHGKNTPIIALENVYPEVAFSRADQLRELVKESRGKFVENAVEKEKMKRQDAERMAEKLIGVTWDVGHINLLRKSGYSEKEIIEETKKISPYVKKVHITDNFGYNDTHLPPGMGNVPIKEMMKEMEKAGYTGKAIMEAGGFVQHFKTSPHPYALEAMNSPIYAEKSPAWGSERGGAYFSGYGPFLPEQHFSMYGAGFAGLPMELGGQIPGKQSRFSGTPVD